MKVIDIGISHVTQCAHTRMQLFHQLGFLQDSKVGNGTTDIVHNLSSHLIHRHSAREGILLLFTAVIGLGLGLIVRLLDVLCKGINQHDQFRCLPQQLTQRPANCWIRRSHLNDSKRLQQAQHLVNVSPRRRIANSCFPRPQTHKDSVPSCAEKKV